MIELCLSVGVLVGVGAMITHALARWTGHAKPLWLVYCAHLLAGLLVHTMGLVPQPDALLYDTLARRQVDFWTGTALFEPTFTDGKEGWMLVLAALYWLLTPDVVLGVIVNCIVVTVTAAVLMKTTQRLGWPDAAPKAAYLTLLPGLLLWSILPLRESFVWLFTALAVWGAAGLLTARTRVSSAAVLVIGLVGSLFFRGSVVVVLVAGLAVGVFLARHRATKLAMVACVVAMVAMAGPGLRAVERTSIGASLDQVNRSRSSLSTAASGFEVERYSGLASVTGTLPSTVPRVIVGPYPNELVELGPLSVVDWTAWMVLLLAAWRGRRAPGRGRWLLASPAFALVLALAATSGNYGTMIRLREQVAIVLVPLAAAGLSHYAKVRRSDRGPHRVAPHGAVRPDRLAERRVVERRP